MMKRIQWLISAVALAAACGDGGGNTSPDSGTSVTPPVDSDTPANDGSVQPDSPPTPPEDAAVPQDAPPPPADAPPTGPSPCEQPTCALQTINLSGGFRAERAGITCVMTENGLTYAIEPYGFRGVALCTGPMNTCVANTVAQIIDDEGVSHRIPAIFESHRDMSGATCSNHASITIRNAMTGEVLSTGTSDAL